MPGLRPELEPTVPDEATVEQLATVIEQIEQALEDGDPVTDLMTDHNRLTGRIDIEAERYRDLYASMSAEEAAGEALMPVPVQVPDIRREELEDIAQRILTAENDLATAYFGRLFEMNTPHGDPDLFFWPDPDWLKQIGTDDPSPQQIVDKALGLS
ncbi:MAG: hypothetical protein AAFQ66_01785 [Pseudomonadota bacterium]